MVERLLLLGLLVILLSILMLVGRISSTITTTSTIVSSTSLIWVLSSTHPLISILLDVLYLLFDHPDSILSLRDLFFEFFVNSLYILELLFNHEPMVSLQDLLVDKLPPSASVQLIIEVVLVTL